MNPLFAPIWLAGIVGPFALRDLARTRFLALAFVIITAIIVGTHGKDYYLAAAYPTAFALGAVTLERAVRNAAVRTVYLVLATAFAAIPLPTVVPSFAGPASGEHFTRYTRSRAVAQGVRPRAHPRQDVLALRDGL